MGVKKLGMMKVLVLALSLLVISMGSRVFNLNINCGTCQSKSGCLGNICMSFSGDVTQENCYGKSTCEGFGMQMSVTLGQCVADVSGHICSSGLCMSGTNVNTCYGNTTDFCLDGVTQQLYCSNKILSSTLYGGLYGTRSNSIWVNMTIPSDCPFSSGRGYYTRCSNDAFGTLCTCCYALNLQGMASASGTCVPADSPIVQVKGSLNGKYGLQSLFSLFLLAVLTLMLIF